MAISLERIRNRTDDLKKSLAAIDSEIIEFRKNVAASIEISDPILQEHLFEKYSEMMEISARLAVYAAAPLDRVDKLEKYFEDRAGVYDLMLHGVTPPRGVSDARDLLKQAYFLSARNECRIWKFSGKWDF